MHLQELSTPFTMNDAQWKLECNGWVGIGIGAYGSVYEKPGYNYVLKLFRGDDKAYIAFVKMVLQYPNIHFPRFRGKLIRLQQGDKSNPGYYAIRMEKLEPTNEVDLSFNEIMYMGAYIDFNNVPPTSDYWKNIYENAIRWLDLEENRSLCGALDLISELGFNLDLKYNNIMKRGETLVFTDPICGYQ